MIFWAVVLGFLALVLFLAWRRDRRYKIDIPRGHFDDLGSDMAAKDPHLFGSGEPPSTGAF